MKSTELRLGNWVEIDRGYCKVVALYTPAYSEWNKEDDYCIVVQALNGCFWECTEDEVKGIEPTQEQVEQINSILSEDDNTTEILEGKSIYLSDIRGHMSLSYIHEVQNIYFIINKEELNLDSLFK